MYRALPIRYEPGTLLFYEAGALVRTSRAPAARRHDVARGDDGLVVPVASAACSDQADDHFID